MQEVERRSQDSGLMGRGRDLAPDPFALAPRDLYRLRHAQLAALDASLRAQLARQNLEVVVLEIERRYGLLGREAAVDVHTGRIDLKGCEGTGVRGSENS